MNEYSLIGFLSGTLENYKSTLRETSYDKNKQEYLCDDESLPDTYDFDAYIRKKFPRSSNTPASPDAIHIGAKKLYFIEFKNQRKGDVDSKNLKDKFKEGTKVLQELLDSFKPRDNQFVFCVVFRTYGTRHSYENFIRSRQVHFGLKELNDELSGFYDEIITQDVEFYKKNFEQLTC